jgi:YidC/Oxa1 family membrane protein insertase
MDRNTLLAIILIGLILLLMGPYYKWTSSVKEKPREAVLVTDTLQMDTLKPLPPKEQIVPKKTEATKSKIIEKDTLLQLVNEYQIRIETSFIQVVLSNRGGGSIRNWSLNNYETWQKVPVEMINAHMNNGISIEFLATDGEDIRLEDYNFNMQQLSDRTIVLTENDSCSLRFTLPLKGNVIVKQLTFYGNSYHFDIQFSLEEPGQIMLRDEYRLGWVNGLPSSERNSVDDYSYSDAYVSMGNEAESYTIKSEEEAKEEVYNGKTDWIAVRTKYFISAIIPLAVDATGAIFSGEGIKIADVLERRYNVALNILQDPGKPTDRYRIYLGPLDHSILKSYDVGLEGLVMSRGWYESMFRPFSLIILALFKFFQRFIANYGIIIVIFSILVKIVLYPLTRKSYKSMKEMSKVQPLVAELREKYKNDPQRINKEMMQLYKEHGINPLGGCLPMLLQMPLLFALFIVFRSTIQLRGASFIPGWIDDLSGMEGLATLPFSLPFYGNQFNILPIIMAVTMIFQSKMTMQDPKQKMMVYIMPVFMLLIFNQLPAGLNLYYTLFNFWTILQQKFIDRAKNPEQVKEKSKEIQPLKKGKRKR